MTIFRKYVTLYSDWFPMFSPCTLIFVHAHILTHSGTTEKDMHYLCQFCSSFDYEIFHIYQYFFSI